MKLRYTSLLLACLMLTAQAWALEKNSKGIYQIGTAQDLADFAALVNGGDTYISAELTADIDYTSKNVQIGGNFNGNFDGKGHTVTYAFSGGESKGVKAALFFNLYGTVENLKVAGTINHTLDNAGGICYYNYGAIRNCVSDVDFTLTKGSSCSCGGISGMATNGSIIEKCIFTGSFDNGGINTTNVAGIIGWSAAGAIIRDCLVIASSNFGKFQSTHRGTATVTNCFYMQDGGTTAFTANDGSTAVTTSQLASGEIAYRLGMTQTIGTETQPNAFGTSSKVYAIGSCNANSATGFTNNEADGTAHTFSSLACTVCSTSKITADCFYEIESKEDMVAFAGLVNDGQTKIKGRLTADIDMKDVEDMNSIGLESKPYTGTFDGQGHKISNLALNSETGNWGLFNTGSNVYLKDFYLDASCSITGKGNNVGVIGIHKGTNATFEKVGSAASITNPSTASGTNAGGLIGGCWCGPDDKNPGTVTIIKCWTAGNIITDGATKPTECGAICGWVNWGTLNLQDCWTVATMDHPVNDKYVARGGSTPNFTNCYSNSGSQIPSASNCCIIDDGEELVWFSQFVNLGGNSANAKLNNNINMDGLTIQPIGSTSKRYIGTFDGQGHSISNLNINQAVDGIGLFITGAKVTLRNFYLDETCTISGNAKTGVIGDHTGSNGLFEKIGTAAKIVGTGENIGGLIGGCWCGGATVNINACWTIGDIQSTSKNCAQFIGWANSGTVNFSNCWSIASMNKCDNNVQTLARNNNGLGATLNFTNCFSYCTLGTQSGVTAITMEDVSNGELTYKLNGDQSDIVWKQTIGTNATPVLTDADRVYRTYMSGANSAYSNTSGATVASMTLTDMADYAADADFTATSLTYERKLAAGGYHSLCLPFAITTDMLSEAGGKLFTLKAVGKDAVTLEETTSVDAGEPCFASVTSEFNFGTMDNVNMVASVNNSGAVKGTFKEITGEDAVGVYKLSDDGTYFAQTVAKGGEITADPVIKPFRSYIAGGASGVKTLNILLSDGTITGLTPSLSEEREAAVIYDLSGRRVAKATKGLYIVNGKKVMK